MNLPVASTSTWTCTPRLCSRTRRSWSSPRSGAASAGRSPRAAGSRCTGSSLWPSTRTRTPPTASSSAADSRSSTRVSGVSRAFRAWNRSFCCSWIWSRGAGSEHPVQLSGQGLRQADGGYFIAHISRCLPEGALLHVPVPRIAWRKGSLGVPRFRPLLRRAAVSVLFKLLLLSRWMRLWVFLCRALNLLCIVLKVSV